MVPPSYAFPVVLVLAAIAAVDSTKTFEENLIRILRNGLLGVWGFAAVMAIPFLLHPSVAMLWLLLVALPVVVYFAHRFTTFCVYWITAHPLGDGLTMLHWFYYDANRQSTPWTFQSACGDTVIREAIFTLIDAALTQRQLEGRKS